MSHSKDKDFNETGKWHKAIFVWMCAAKQIGSFRGRLPLCIVISEARRSLTRANHNFDIIARYLINLLLFYSNKIINTHWLIGPR